ncbi:MAG TPA: glycosyltransferase family 39 protein, partial [Acidobacteriaceae bacterium]|nr:glycosyltransferase family 39 protein [Acidobacteriaceae bacterium]
MSTTLTSPDTVASTGQRPAPSIRYRNGLLCALLVAACLWVAWPVSNMGFLDDWSYAHIAKVFAANGHLIYDRWSTPMLGWQIVWGALFIKLFGFSFAILRVSMLPIAMATVFLFHQVLLRFGVTARNAVIGTLTLGLSPVFMPLADSFMTDIPGLLVILICIYFCQRAMESTRTRAAILWLVLAAGSNVLGGTVRQIAWLG